MYSAADVVAECTLRRESSAIPRTATAVPAIGNGRHLPHLLIERPAAIDVTSRPPIIGVSCNPDFVGLISFTICRKTGKYVIDPNSARPIMKPVAAETANVRLRKRSGGRIASLARRSTDTNVVSNTTDSTIRTIDSLESHANVVPPRLVNRTTHESPPASSAAPR